MRERSTFINSKRQRPEKKKSKGLAVCTCQLYKYKGVSRFEKSGINFAMQNSVTQF